MAECRVDRSTLSTLMYVSSCRSGQVVRTMVFGLFVSCRVRCLFVCLFVCLFRHFGGKSGQNIIPHGVKTQTTVICMYLFKYMLITFVFMYEGWNFNSGNYLFTTDTK